MDHRREMEDAIDVEESLEHNRDAFDHTDHEMVKADLRAAGVRSQKTSPPAVENGGKSDSVDEQELSRERRRETQETGEPRSA